MLGGVEPKRNGARPVLDVRLEEETALVMPSGRSRIFDNGKQVRTFRETSPVHAVPLEDGGPAAKELPIDVKNLISIHATKISPDLVI